MCQELLEDVKVAAQQAQTGKTRIAWADADRLLVYYKQELPEEMRELVPKLRLPDVLAVSRRLARAEELGEMRSELNEFESTTVEMASRYLRCANLFHDL